MKCDLAADGGSCVLHVDNPLNVRTAPDFLRVTRTDIPAGIVRVVVDMAAVTVIDSFGIGLLLSLRRRLQESGATIEIVNCGSEPLAAMKLIGMDQVFSIR